jgi:hypothetical protein
MRRSQTFSGLEALSAHFDMPLNIAQTLLPSRGKPPVSSQLLPLEWSTVIFGRAETDGIVSIVNVGRGHQFPHPRLTRRISIQTNRTSPVRSQDLSHVITLKWCSK